MANAIANISAALGYDVAETMLAEGASLASVLAFEALRVSTYEIDRDCSPASTRDLTIPASTVAPAKRAA